MMVSKRTVRTTTGTAIVTALVAVTALITSGSRQPADATSASLSVQEPSAAAQAPTTTSEPPGSPASLPAAPVVSPSTTTSTSAPTTTTKPAGSSDVEAAQRSLLDLGFWLGNPDGKVGTSTQQALLAFQKVNDLPKTSKLDDATRQRLQGASRPQPQTAGDESGDWIEIDKTHQVIYVVRDHTVQWVFNTSTGTEKSYNEQGHRGVANTPTGTFSVLREVNASDPGPLGALYRPKYFTTTGIAVHGAPVVPATPASHGCARVTNAVMDFIWAQDLMPKGITVIVHGTSPTK